MGAVTVRKAQFADAGEIASLHVRSWQSGYRGLVPDAILDGLSVDERTDMWRNVLGDEHTRSFTLSAHFEDSISGFCSIAAPSRDDDADERTCEVAAIYVEPAAWRRGIGSALTRAALESARSDGWLRVTLWVFAQNHRAQVFYRRFGFVPEGTERSDEEIGQRELRLSVSLLE